MANLLEFDPNITRLQEDAIHMSKAQNPDFSGAEEAINLGRAILLERNPALKRDVHLARVENDRGVIGIRRGLHDMDIVITSDGVEDVRDSYDSIKFLARPGAILSEQQYLLPAIRANIGATQKCWFQGTQSLEALSGKLTKTKKATDEIVAEQWMLGRGTPIEPGAYKNGKEGDNKYWSTQTCFVGMRGEIVNGGAVHYLKAAKWFLRGLPELGKALVSDPDNRGQAVLTAGRLTLESLGGRKRALEAVLDYRRF